MDNRETITVELDRDLLFQLMMMAHERDITLNQLVEEILQRALQEAEENKS